MRDDAETETARYVFKAKEGGPGTVFIALRPFDEKRLTVLGNGFLAFTLREGTDFEQAKEVAAYLNRHVSLVGYTAFFPPTDAPVV